MGGGGGMLPRSVPFRPLPMPGRRMAGGGRRVGAARFLRGGARPVQGQRGDMPTIAGGGNAEKRRAGAPAAA